MGGGHQRKWFHVEKVKWLKYIYVVVDKLLMLAMLASIKATTLTVLVAVNAGKHHLVGAGKLLPRYV